METENEENNENRGVKMTSDIFDDLFGGFDAMNRRFEALFSDLKNKLRNHNGMSRSRKIKMILEYFNS